jgi:hypothetical protein
MTRSKWAALGFAFYALFLLTTPFLHHDLACEMKTPQHCTACASSVLGADPNPPIAPGESNLEDAGRLVAEQVLVNDLLLTVRSTGRSPPAVRL